VIRRSALADDDPHASQAPTDLTPPSVTASAPTIVSLHNRTVETVAREMALPLEPASRDDEQVLVNAEVMNVGLAKHVAAFGARDTVWKLG